MLPKNVCDMQPNIHAKLRKSWLKSLDNTPISHSYGCIYNSNRHFSTMSVIFRDNEACLSTHLKDILQTVSEESIQERNIFTIGVSGGSSLKFLTHAILSLNNCDLEKWKFFFCDERIVPETSEDSTFGAYKRHLICNSELNENQFVKIKEGLDAEAAAENYIQQMKPYFPIGNFPVFDFLLLGMGPDGHTCSLFPEHKLLGENKAWVAPILDSPKPPPQRITLTLPVLNNARNCAFVIAGQEKGPMAKRVFVDKDQTLPAARVQPKSGTLYLIIEEGLIE